MKKYGKYIILALVLILLGSASYYWYMTYSGDEAKKKAEEDARKKEQDRINKLLADSVPTETDINEETEPGQPIKAVNAGAGGEKAISINSAAGRQLIDFRRTAYATNAGIMRKIRNRIQPDAGWFEGITATNKGKILTAIKARFPDYTEGISTTAPFYVEEEKPGLKDTLVSVLGYSFGMPGDNGGADGFVNKYSLAPGGLSYSFYASDGNPAQNAKTAKQLGVFNKVNAPAQEVKIFAANWLAGLNNLSAALESAAIESLVAENRLTFE